MFFVQCGQGAGNQILLFLIGRQTAEKLDQLIDFLLFGFSRFHQSTPLVVIAIDPMGGTLRCLMVSRRAMSILYIYFVQVDNMSTLIDRLLTNPLKKLPFAVHIIHCSIEQLSKLQSFAFLKTCENSTFQFQKLVHDEAFFLTPQFGEINPH